MHPSIESVVTETPWVPPGGDLAQGNWTLNGTHIYAKTGTHTVHATAVLFLITKSEAGGLRF